MYLKRKDLIKLLNGQEEDIKLAIGLMRAGNYPWWKIISIINTNEVQDNCVFINALHDFEDINTPIIGYNIWYHKDKVSIYDFNIDIADYPLPDKKIKEC